MDGGQDLGGMHGLGPVLPEPNEPPFHEDWERRAFALTLAMGFTGQWNIDISRHARESRPPAEYLSKTYYEIWTAGLEKLLLDAGLVSAEELEDGTSHAKPAKLARILEAANVEAALAKGGPADRPAAGDAAFAAGDAVMTRTFHTAGHTRLPRYARGRPGVIDSIRGHHVFPDVSATGDHNAAQWLYSVRFAAADLWGADTGEADDVFIDLWESYLERR